MYLLLLAIGYIDMKEKRIPDELNILLFYRLLFFRPRGLLWGLIVFISLSFIYYSLHRFYSSEPLGYGDVKLFSVLSVALKDSHWYFIVMSFFLAGIVGSFFFFSGRKKLEIPLAPFIIISFLYFK